ncbi:MAG TPA: oxygenase MpaB family protein [Ktedonobacteraceae bacterium]|jgi:uncharacterized protein (DUF2236 family)|nr:oxygenase MpaB family protein [Ktedonobacteraceae bacterium]
METQREQKPTSDGGYFGSNSITWKLAREAIINLGGARAVLMQLAHPLVAMGVSEHSSYMRDPLGRSWRTFLLGHMLAFGSTSTARQAARTVNRLHAQVYGTLPEKVGAYHAGTPYRARDPELLLWVEATLIDTVLLIYPLFFRPLSDAEQEQYYQESKAFSALLGLPAKKMPATLADLRQYIHDMVYSDRLAATPQARQIAHQVLFPPAPGMLRPFMHLHLQFTCALLPQPVREIYGLEWSPQRQMAFELSAAGMRMVIPHLPLALRVLPLTRRLMERGSVA